jgi:hypothetical protein
VKKREEAKTRERGATALRRVQLEHERAAIERQLQRLSELDQQRKLEQTRLQQRIKYDTDSHSPIHLT